MVKGKSQILQYIDRGHGHIQIEQWKRRFLKDFEFLERASS